MPLNEVAGRNIHRIRRALGMRQGDLEEICGVTQQYISGVEKGHRNLSLTTLAKIAEGLGVEPAELLRDADAPGAGSRPVRTVRPTKAQGR